MKFELVFDVEKVEFVPFRVWQLQKTQQQIEISKRQS